MSVTVLKSPSLGPIVGHTTQDFARLWIRGIDADDAHRTVGIAALFDGKKLLKGSAQYFRLHRDYDRTGTVDFEGLTPGSKYTARVGCLVLESQDPNIEVGNDGVFTNLPKPDNWSKELQALPPGESTATFSTFPDPQAGGALKFVFGSCRYPGLFTTKKSDSIYATMEDFATKEGYRFALLVGDQIYADTLHRTIPILRADTETEFHERYVTAFGSPRQRSFMQRLATYMILDDHEIEDNWVNGRLSGDEKARRLFNMAIQAYLSYQWVHGPRQQWDANRKSAKYLYYQFECMGFPFFVLDERTQREKGDNDNDLSDNHLLGKPAKTGVDGKVYEGQLERFCRWLIEQQKTVGDKPKFVVSASVFAPSELSGRNNPMGSDSWPAFPETRKKVLETIVSGVKGGVQNVVFLGGDVHCSNVAEITFEGTPEAARLKAFSITSSAFYWPLPFADGDPNSFVHDSKAEDDGFRFLDNKVTMHYKAWGFEQDDNFTEVSADHVARRIVIRNIGRDGNVLQNSTLQY